MTRRRLDNDNTHGGHRNRHKKQFIQSPESFLDHKKLELTLFYPIPRRDTNPLAHELINHFGSLKAVLQASPDELIEVKGVGAHTAAFLHALAEVSKRLMLMNEPPGISSANEFMLEALLYSSLAVGASEQLFLACLDDRLRVTYSEVFNIEDAENGRPEFIAAWLAKRGVKRFIVAKYRADGDFDRAEERKTAYTLKNHAPPNAVLMKYILADDNAVITIEL